MTKNSSYFDDDSDEEEQETRRSGSSSRSSHERHRPSKTDDDDEEEDPLDAFMAGVEAQARKDCGDSVKKQEKVASTGEYSGGQTGRDDIEEMDMVESQIKYEVLVWSLMDTACSSGSWKSTKRDMRSRSKTSSTMRMGKKRAHFLTA